MTVDRKMEAALALHRFGFGPVRDQIAAIADDPRGALLADLERPQAGQVAAANLPSSGQASRALYEYRAEQQAKQKLAQPAKKEAEPKSAAIGMSDAANAGPAAAPSDQTQVQNPQPQLPTQLVQNEAKVRYDGAIGADVGYVERLVWFWSNHFCISADKIISQAGAYEREAIRPHVLGSFSDILQAVEGHLSGDVVLPRQCRIDGRGIDGWHQPRQRAQREPRPRDSRAAHAGDPQRLFGRRTSQASPTCLPAGPGSD